MADAMFRLMCCKSFLEKCREFVPIFQKPFAGRALAVHLGDMVDADLPFTLPKVAMLSVEDLPFPLSA